MSNTEALQAARDLLADMPTPDGYYNAASTVISKLDAAMAHADQAGWWALVMGAAASIEDAANCLRDPDAKRQAEGAAKHYREAAQKLWGRTFTASADTAAPDLRATFARKPSSHPGK